MYIRTTNPEEIRRSLELLNQYSDKITDLEFSLDAEIASTDLFLAIHDQQWPEAVSVGYIVNPNDRYALTERAKQITFLYFTSLEGKKFLDFGCGTGHVAKQVSTTCLPELAVGYDICPNPFWLTLGDDKTKFSTSLPQIKEQGPYDIILIYDVLDHITDPEQLRAALEQVRDLLTPDGIAYVRCHPWTARHGADQYFVCNKAFVHLFFDPAAFMAHNINLPSKLQYMRPLATHQQWFVKAGFTIKSRQPTRTPVEDYFTQPLLLEQLQSQYPDITKEQLVGLLSTDYVDYTLTKC